MSHPPMPSDNRATGSTDLGALLRAKLNSPPQPAPTSLGRMLRERLDGEEASKKAREAENCAWEVEP